MSVIFLVEVAGRRHGRGLKNASRLPADSGEAAGRTLVEPWGKLGKRVGARSEKFGRRLGRELQKNRQGAES